MPKAQPTITDADPFPREQQTTRRRVTPASPYPGQPMSKAEAFTLSGPNLYRPEPRSELAMPHNPLVGGATQLMARRLREPFVFTQNPTGQWVDRQTGRPADQLQLELAFRSRREALQAQGSIASATRLQQGQYYPGDLTRISEGEGDPRLARTILQNIRVDALAGARAQGKRQAVEHTAQDAAAGGIFGDVANARSLVGQQAAARSQWQGLNIEHGQAMESGNFGAARKLEKSMNDLRGRIMEWGDQIKAVQPSLKEHKSLLSDQNKQIGAEIQQLQAINKSREALRTRLESVAAQRGPGFPEATENAQQRVRLERDISGRQARIEGLTTQREGIRTQMAELGGLSSLAAPRVAKGAPMSFAQEAGGILRQSLNPQQMFYGLSNLSQMQYSLWGPLTQARDAYQQSQFTRGQMMYSLGAGSMGDTVGRDRANQAARADAWTRFGGGVNKALQPVDDLITQQLRGSQPGEGQTDLFESAGQLGTYGAIGMTGLLGARTFGLDRLAWAGAKGVGRAVGLPALMAPVTQRAAGVLPGLAEKASGVALGGVGRLAGLGLAGFEGVNLGAWGYDQIRAAAGKQGEWESGWGTIRKGVGSLYGAVGMGLKAAGLPGTPEDWRQTGQYAQSIAGEDNSAMATARRLAAGGGALASMGAAAVQRGLGFDEQAIQKREMAAGNFWGAFANQGILPAISQAWTGGVPTGTTKQEISQQTPLPVEIKKIDSPDDLIRAMGQTSARAAGLPLDQFQFSEDQLRKVTKEFAESSGLDFAQLKDMKGQGFQTLQRAIEMGVRSGLDPEQLVSYFGKAPGAAGYLPGGASSLPFLDFISQGKGLTDLQNRMQSLQATSQASQFAGFNPAQQIGIAGRWQEIAQQEGEFRAQRELSRLTGGNAYDYSDLARRSGRADLALVDEGGRPLHQQETWAIQDRQRQWQVNTQMERGQQEIGWQQERFDLEQKFWDFRMARRQEDHDFTIRQFDLQKQQMEFAIEREEKQAQMQSKYQQQQFALQKQIFDLQTKYQRQDFDKQEARLDTQRGWQVQDFAWNRESFELQAGWQQEDLERAMRYASGRERIDIRRQMERTGVLAERKRTEMDRDEARATTKFEWSEDDLATARKRFEEMRPLQEEMMNLSRQYWEEQKQFGDEDRARRKEMMQEQLALMTDRHNAYLNNYNAETGLLNEQHNMERGMAGEKLEWAKADAEEAKRRAGEEQQLIEWQRQAIENQQKFSMIQQLGWSDAVKKAGELSDIQKKMIEQAQTWADIMSSDSSSQGNNTPPPGPGGKTKKMAAGGSTRGQPTLAWLSEYGQDEFVVPSGGALVLREKSGESGVAEAARQTNHLLQAILNAILASTKDGGQSTDLRALISQGIAAEFATSYHVD